MVCVVRCVLKRVMVVLAVRVMVCSNNGHGIRCAVRIRAARHQHKHSHQQIKQHASQKRKAAKNKKKVEEKLASYGPQAIPLGTGSPTAPAQVGAPQAIQAAPPPETNVPTPCAHPTPAPDTSQRQPGSRRLLASVIATLVTRKDDTPRPGVDLNHTPPAPPLVIEGPALDTVCDKPSGISISNDEIDSEKTDAFGLFLLDDMATDPEPIDKFAYEAISQYPGTR